VSAPSIPNAQDTTGVAWPTLYRTSGYMAGYMQRAPEPPLLPEAAKEYALGYAEGAHDIRWADEQRFLESWADYDGPTEAA
jgi:hypothetical protein